MTRNRFAYSFVALASFATFSSIANAQTVSQVYGSALTRQTQTVFARGEAGWTTYDSEAAESTATAGTSTYTVGGYAGEDRLLGIMFSSTDHRIPFKLNDSEANNSFRDLRVQGRLGWIYPSFVASQTEMKVTRGDEVVTDFYGNYVGGGVGLYVPLWRKLVVHGDAMVMNATQVTDKNQREIKLGSRQEGEVAASVDLTDQLLDLVVGYRLKKFSVEVDGESYDESMSSPFAGLQFGFYF